MINISQKIFNLSTEISKSIKNSFLSCYNFLIKQDNIEALSIIEEKVIETSNLANDVVKLYSSCKKEADLSDEEIISLIKTLKSPPNQFVNDLSQIVIHPLHSLNEAKKYASFCDCIGKNSTNIINELEDLLYIPHDEL